MESPGIVIIGAGPAGLTAAYELAKAGVVSTVLEKDDVVGGIARTATYKGYRFDIGGHRFFTKVTLVEQMWREVLGGDLIRRSRLSRIYYHGKFYYYPLRALNALMNLGLLETMRCMASYGWAKLHPRRPENDFATWVTNRFGRRLFEIFFKTYTEKVWGIPCTEIQAEWAAQRIKGLSLSSAIKNALFGELGKSKDEVIKTLIDEFDYPRHGPGMMWTRTKALVEARGSRVIFHAPVDRIYWREGGVEAVEAGGEIYPLTHLISSMPVRELIEKLSPAPPDELLAAASNLHYRDFLTVALVVNKKDLFPDNWIYVHDKDVKLGRIQNFNNWSPEMVPDPSTTCLGLEYFCFEGDGLWTSADRDLIELGKREIGLLGLVNPADVIDGAVVRMPKAYPVYDGGYEAAMNQVRRFLPRVPNLQLVGRNGMHRYNNQDHSMLTAILAARNILGGRYDLWQVNVEQEYHEEGAEITADQMQKLEETQPLVPQRRSDPF
ncbi:MAG TPA: NAD(P)/FAD-dependent oxidoreductase [Bryobacterales bacterium]|nr:NAD(P)/FAD-dependent oxidoreductase [Bryobacterales bacterium]